MATLNINRSVQDPFYRYKMPKLLAKVEGNGNGIKTVIPNMVEIAKSLARPPSYPTKFFGCELGAQVQMDERAERYIVNGCHDQAKLQDLLFNFIDKFVLCVQCGNPETTLKVSKKKTIEQACVACGHHNSVPLVHKLTTFIINHPPDQPAEIAKATKADKRGKKADEASVDIADSAVRSNVAERAEGNIAAPAAQLSKDEEDEVWSEEISEAAVRERAANLGLGAASMTMNDDLERSIEERLEIFHKFVQTRLAQPKLPAKEILAEAERLDCKDKAVISLATLLLDDDQLLARIDTHRVLLARFTTEDAKAQKYLLGGLERVLEHRPALQPRMALVLKRLYEADIVEEEAILAWAEKPSKKFVSKEINQKLRDAATPFIKWLKEAEEESDEPEEEEDNIVGFDSAAGSTLVTTEAKEEAKPEDDVDIDAI